MPKRALTRHQVKKRKNIVAMILLLTLFCSGIAGGANTTLAQSFLSFAIAVLFFLTVLIVPLGRAEDSSLFWLPKCFMAMAVVALLQLISLPCNILALVSPLSAETYALISNIVDRDCIGSISTNRYAAFQALVWWCTLAAYSWLLIVVAHKNEQRTILLKWGVVAFLVFESVYGVIMVSSGAELGSYFQPKTAYRGDAVGTLVNRNHFAAMMYIGALLILPDVIRASSKPSKDQKILSVFWWLTSSAIPMRVVLIMLAIGAVMSHSRMGASLFAAGLTVSCALALLLSIAKRGASLAKPSYLVFVLTSLLAIDLIVVSQWFGLEQVVQRLENTELTQEGRANVNRDILNSDWIEKSLLTGTGAGSFELSYLRYETEVRSRSYDHAHNDWIEFALEYGLLGYLILGFALFKLIRTVKNLSLSQGLIALVLISMLTAHAVVDFALRIPTVAMVAIAAMVLVLNDLSFSPRKGVRKRPLKDR